MKTRTQVLTATTMTLIKQKTKISFLLFFSFFLFNTSFAQNQKETELNQKVDHLLNSFFQANYPGGTALLAKEGKIIYHKGFGKSNLESGKNITTDQVFGIASLSKPIAACAILKLSEQGKLSLKDDITKYIPDYPTEGHKITIEHLLSHTSGIYNYTNNTNEQKKIEKHHFTVEEKLDKLKSIPLDFVPGEKYSYSNSGYFLLGYIIEKITNKSYEDYMQEEFFTPLGMKNTVINKDQKIIKKRATGYEAKGENFIQKDLTKKTLFPDGGIQTTAKDLHIWYDALINNKIISKASFELATTPFQLNDGSLSQTGLGWFIGDLLGSKLINHDGLISGYTSSLVYLPSEKIFALIILNCNWWGRGDELAAIPHRLAAFAQEKTIQSSEKISIEKLNQYEGVYQSKFDDFKRFQIRNNKLFLIKKDRSRKELFHYKDDQFLIPTSNETIVFKRENKQITGLTSTHLEAIEFAKTEKNIDRTSLANLIYQSILQDGYIAGILQFYNHESSSDHYLEERELNRAIFALYQSNRIEDAKSLFHFSNKQFSDSGQSLALSILFAFKEKGIEDAKLFYKKYKADYKYYHWEDELNNVGYTIMGSGNIKDAIEIFKMNTESFPESDNAFDSLAEAYLNDDQNEKALKNYSTSVNLKEDNSFLKMALIMPTAYQPTQLPEDTTELFYSSGNKDNDTVYIFAQGGPLLELTVKDYDPFYYFPNQDNLLKIYTRQSQIINPTLLSVSPALSKSQSEFEHHQSAEILHRTISYFKKQGKTVFVIGHSYGAMISLEYLNSYENQPDRLILMGMNIDSDLRNYKDLKSGHLVRWKDGLEPYQKPLFSENDFPVKSILKKELDLVFENTNNLVQYCGEKRFTKLLKDKDLSNVIFVHAKSDESIGRVKKYELDFLKSKGATTVETIGDHHSMFTFDFMKKLYNHLSQNKSLNQK